MNLERFVGYDRNKLLSAAIKKNKQAYAYI
jgi:hypothetical protein